MTSSEDQPQRKLAAVLQVDMAGYSRLMGDDEAGTLARLKILQQDLLYPTVKAFHGRIVKLMGDGLLVEYPSVVEAVACAVTIQQRMAQHNRDVADSEKIQFRVGINLSDVIIDGDDIYGDGVNICARLEGLAPTGGICISGTVYDALGNKLPLDFKSLGEQKVKNIAQPVRVYSVQLAAGAELPKPGEQIHSAESLTNSARKLKLQKWLLAVFLLVFTAVLALLSWLQPWQQKESSLNSEGIVATSTNKPSIAVLPFSNMSGDSEQEYFSDGISEDIITKISQLKNLAVIARNSSFTYKGTNTKVQDIGKDLGVRYVLEGSVRKVDDRVRITAQLIDSHSGHQLWAEKFDRKLTDVFAVQDEITDRITTALSVKLSVDEQTQVAKNSTNNFEAYDLFLKGQRASATMAKEGLDNAIGLYREAIRLDPGFARAYGSLAVTMERQTHLGYTDSPVEASERALKLAQKAVSIDPSSPQAQWALAYVYMRKKQFDDAIAALEKAIEVAPNYADGYGLLALIYNNLGQAEDALRLIKKGMELNPYYTYDYPYNLGRAYYTLKDYAKAAQQLENAIERNEAIFLPRLYLAASYVQLGRQDEAEWQITELEVLIPGSTISHWEKIVVIADEDLRKRLFNDLRAAGMAE
jgi:TolB-like protein/class 3 adenylate cyclase/cytochrome c-type biogenesis protein CcmH/NrfG